MAEQTVRIDSSVPVNITGTVNATLAGMTAASTTLTAVTTGTGATVDFGSSKSNISMAILVSGTVTGGTVFLDVSQDGTNWVPFSSLTPVTNTNAKLASSNESWRYARGRIGANITGGATITATLMAGG